ncbi:MAG: class I SAM-dependent methyltransferase [Novosphingobium sp.]|nr:class I SAM-dependent methyltransferase [Novosphingobium sp.]
MPTLDANFIAEIDAFLTRLEGAKDDEEMRQFFETFSEKYELDVPSDPFSCEYRRFQFEIYEQLAGKVYSPSNEVTKFDVTQLAQRPFPYLHGSSGLVGDHLMAIGFAIKAMNLPQGSRILEFGPGWGNITLALAKMGHSVTAIDVEEDFINLIRRRAEMEQLSIDLILGDFTSIQSLNEKYDAILFFECFHHCADHISLIEGCERILNPEGMICFAAEPINEHFPIPWGLRMDGQSLWAIRKNGWLELGFNVRYFTEALSRSGFRCEEKRGLDSPASHVLIARRASEFSQSQSAGTFTFSEGDLRNACGFVSDGTLSIAAHDTGFACFGPYRPFPPGNYELVIEFSGYPSCQGEVRIEVTSNVGAKDLAIFDDVKVVEHESFRRQFSLPFFVTDLEVRIFTKGGASFEMREIHIIKVTPFSI